MRTLPSFGHPAWAQSPALLRGTLVLLLGGLLACGVGMDPSETQGLSGGPPGVGDGSLDSGMDSGSEGGSAATEAGLEDTGATDDGLDDSGGPADTGPTPPACSAPDVLIVLDRTSTMYLDAGGNQPASMDASRWSIAVQAVEQVVQGSDGEGTPLDQTVRFGLELFPQYHPECSTVGEMMGGAQNYNPQCQGPELLVEPALGTGPAIADPIDPATSELCESTPMRQALEGAASWLGPLASSDHEQYVLLVTDGVDTQSFCSGPMIDGYPDALVAVQNLQAAGVGTFILGVGTGFGTTGSVHQTMNDFACAGGTAPDPDVNCMPGAMGMVAVPGLAQALYFAAGDTPQLVGQLVQATEQVCCGCVPVG